jgi:hypothetical protein
MFDIIQRLSPALADWYLTSGDRIFKEQVSDRPAPGKDSLFQPPPGPRSVRGRHAGQAKSTSLYTRSFEWHPSLKPVALGALALGAIALANRASRSRWANPSRIAHSVRGAVDAIG